VTHQLDIAAAAERQFKKLTTQQQLRLRKAILGLAVRPRPRGCRKLLGYRDVYRIRVGRYRVIYSVDDERVIVLVLKLGHRGEVYDRSRGR